MKSATRNIFIFALVSLTCGFVGQALNNLYGPADPMQSLGTLVWLVSPLLAGLLGWWLHRRRLAAAVS